MQLDRIPDLLQDQVDRVRDRTAEAVSADGGSVLRELSKLGRKIDGTEKHLADRLERIAAATSHAEERLDELETMTSNATTWPRRLFWIIVGLGAGAAAAYLADPERGDQRRQELVGQAQQRVQTVTGDVSERARSVKDEVVERAADVKDQAFASARSVGDEAKRAAGDVKDEAQHAVVDVREEVQDAGQNVRDQARSDAPAGTGSSVPVSPPPAPRA